MEKSNMKNIVVLKNIPSNLVDEAILILKTNKNAKKLEHVCNSSKENFEIRNSASDYIVKEAESVIANYISKIEGKKEIKKVINISENKKYKRLKTYSIIVSIVLLFAFIKSII